MNTGLAPDGPLTAQATNAALIGKAADWLAGGHRLALAFVMQTWGSSPRPAGSLMLVREDMAVEGSVSGGCIEGAVIEAALSALETGTGQRLDFGVADETAWEVGLSCGGKIAVLVTPVAGGGLPAASLKSMAADIAARRPVAISFDPTTGALLRTPVRSVG
jgi:xanthine dehydrogenase accessory factor